MSIELIAAISAITAALVFYTIGVFGERKAHKLTGFNLIMFYLGLVCDTTGTTIMANIAKTHSAAMPSASLSLHAITGGLAIILMLFHAIWATVVMIRNNEEAKANFHKFSGIVWCFWLVPYICGLFIGGPAKLPGFVAIISSIILALLAYVFLIRPKDEK